MSNFPPPAYGGQYYPPQAHPSYHPQNAPYQVNHQNQYLQHPSHQAPYQSPNTPQEARFVNPTAFNQNQVQPFYGHPQPTPSHSFYYPQHIPNNPGQSFPQGYIPTGQAFPSSVPSALNPITDYANSYTSATVLRAVQNSVPFGPPSSAVSHQQAAVAQGRPEETYSMDRTDEIIQRALASTTSNVAKEPPFEQLRKHGTHPSEPHAERLRHRGIDAQSQSLPRPQDDQPAQNEQASSPYTPVEHISSLPGLPPAASLLVKETQAPIASAVSEEQWPSHGVWQDRRDAAKKAVTEMLRAGVTLDQISQEGVDLVLLYQLFPELAPQKYTSKAHITAHASSLLSPSQRGRSVRSLESGEVSESDGYLAAVKANGKNTVDEKRSTVNLHTAADSNIMSNNDALSRPGEERKDIIARLLAAKKTAIQEPLQSSKTAGSASTVQSTDPVGSSSAGVVMPTANHASQHIKRSGGKDPVQTELVRKRIEALKAAKRPDAIQTTIVDTRPIEAMQPPERHSSQRDLGPDSHKQPAPGSAGPTSIPSAGVRSSGFTPRSNSFYAEGDEQEFAGLPGLSPMLVKAPPLSGFPRQPRDIETAQVPEIITKRVDDQVAIVQPSTSDQPPSLDGTQIPRPMQSAQSQNGGAINRKRATANDFIDIDSPPPKKRVGSDHPIQLVIDVSEDEDGENLVAPGSGLDQLVSGDYDATTSFSNRPLLSKAHSTESASKTTPLGNSKSLSAIEAEMKAMKEKIAARQKTRRALIAREIESSRGVSTGASNSEAASPHIGDPGSTITSGDEELKSKQQQQQRALAASRTLLQEKLEAERRTHALMTAHAEQESRKAAQASDAVERGNRLGRKATLEAAIPKLQASINDKMQLLENIRKQQDELMHDVERSRREHQIMLEELNVLLSTDVHMNDVSSSHEHKHLQALPLENTDVVVTHTPDTKCEVLPKDRVAIDTSAELADPSRHSPATASSHAETGNFETAMDISGPSDDDLQRHDREASDVDSLFDSKPTDKRLHQIQAHDRLSTTGLSSGEGTQREGEDSYDLSMDERFSDDDDGNDDDPDDLGAPDSQEAFPESARYSSESAASQASGGASEENVMHQAILGSQQMQSQATGTSSVEGDSAILEKPTSNVGQSQGSEDGELSDDELSSSEEYEPPEASLNADPVPASLASISHDGSSRSRAQPGKYGDGGINAIVGRGDLVPAEAPREFAEAHFQPYESPLTRFTSYRFHPQYLANVLGGFRSLTFSHQIRTDALLCRWETAGGVCNDATCEYQHFRDLSLTDDKVLQQLSALHEGKLPEDEDHHKASLRQLLTDAHNTDSEDVEATAAKIVAFRCQLLTDPAHVIAHFSSHGAS